MMTQDTWHTIAEIRMLGLLEDDWDGYGASPINPAIIAAAEGHVQKYQDAIVSPPQVVPMSGGRLQLEWKVGDKELEVEFETPATIHYLASCEGYDPDEDTHSIEDDFQCRRGYDWLFGRLGPML